MKCKKIILEPLQYKKSKNKLSLLLVVIAMFFTFQGCGVMNDTIGNVKNMNKSDDPEEIELPSNPIERAAVSGLVVSYKDSTMWQIQKVNVKSMTPMAPTGILIELQDPKELYCVCIEYEARYKVTWTTSEGSPWEKTIRNILVMKTQGDQYIPLKPMNICAPFCQ